MRKTTYKGRCEKQTLEKFTTICKTYDPIQTAYANILVQNKDVTQYLCLYLVYQELSALAPQSKAEKELTQDKKNMRWALNKFFYTKNKNSLMTAYTLMLKEKYCDQHGQLVAAYPTFDQFRYFYRKTKKMQQYYISRDGIKDYQRNNRPLLGDGVQQFAPAVGVGMLDSTICDMRYCPMCAAADREQHGETYWHRKHQLPGVEICMEHRCRLENSSNGITVESQRFKLIHAEMVIPQYTPVNLDVSDLEYQLSDYVMQIFDADMDFDSRRNNTGNLL